MPKNRIPKAVSAVGRALSGIFALMKFDKVNGSNDPGATEKRINNMKRIAAMVGILIIVFFVVILLLRGCQGDGRPHGSVDIPGNVIDPAPPIVIPKADLEFNNANAEENLPFYEKEMDGGSGASQLYRIIAAYNSDFILKYGITIREDEEFQRLAEVLNVKVEIVRTTEDTLLYDGLLFEMPNLELALNAEAQTSTEYLFRVTVYLEAPLGEEYYGQKLVSDMSWWIEEQDNISVANCEFATVSKLVPPAPPVITPDLNFIKLNEGDNTPFDMKDIENGGSQIKFFAFDVIHGEDIEVLISNTVVCDSKLAEVLKAKLELVEEGGNRTLYEGLLKDLSAEHTVSKNETGKTTVYYKITVIANGLTEEYCETKFVCDISWVLKGTSEQLKVPSNSFEAYDKPYIPPDPPTPPQTATAIELTAKDGYENVPFDVKNMLPGDSAAQYYCVSVTHSKTETVRFGISFDTAKKLSNVLRVKIERLIPNNPDKVLCDGLMKDCKAVDVSVTASSETVTPIYYRVTVYTNGREVGNKYAGESLAADFSWQLQ